MTFDPTQPLAPDFREAVGLAVSGASGCVGSKVMVEA